MPIIDLLKKMIEEKASDIFITAGKNPCLRINTLIQPLDQAPVTTEQINEFRKKNLLPEAERTFQETGNLDAGITLEPGLRFRINFLMQQGVPALVVRLVPSGNLSFEDLNLPSTLAEFAESPRGLILAVGPAGSGKSTTMAAMLNHINTNFSKHIVTIEDPIEFIHHDKKCLITQREVGADTTSFAEALKHVVRESPDVIFIGEMRDVDTMQTAISAALTGHLVISTLHTADVVQCVERIINHFPEHLRDQAAADLSLALEGIIAQRIVSTTDKKGLVPAVEILRATPLARHVIASRNFGELEDVIKRGQEEGMQTFARALADLCKSGKITVETGANASNNRDEFLLLTQGMESGVETFRIDSDEEEGDSFLNIKRLLHTAVANDASDLLITARNRPCLRLNGELNFLATDILTPADTKRLLFSILNSKQREVFEEKREIDFALSVNIQRTEKGKTKEPIPYRFRINGFYQRGTVSVAVRIIPRKIPSPKELGLPQALVDLTEKHQGLILMTGPTGHGKSTTQASLIDKINANRPCHIITIEDPIEYVHTNKLAVVEQREVFADTLSFANALKYVLRQDPDVILVGEMRDPETIAAALTAAETGHLVMATLHTNDAAQSIDRIVDSFPAHQQNQIRIQLAGTLLGIVSQRLIQRRDGKDRVAAFELMIGTSAVRNLIREGKTHLAVSVMETSAKDGMITMDKALKELYEKNIIKRQDALSLMSTPQSRDMSSL